MIHLLDLEHIRSFQSLKYLYHSHIIKRNTPIFIILGSDEASRMIIFLLLLLPNCTDLQKAANLVFSVYSLKK